MTSAQFYATIAALVLNGNEITDLISIDSPSFYALLGNLYDADTLVLSKHPLIAGIGLNGKGELDDLDSNSSQSGAKVKKSSFTSQQQSKGRVPGQAVHIEATDDLANRTALTRRDLSQQNAIEEIVQFEDANTGAFSNADNEPFALQWLGSLWAQNALFGNCKYIAKPLVRKN